MKIFTIIGYTNSGKTGTLIEIIKELVKRGYNVNSVKHVHIENFSIDTKGKDSWKHREAGASITAVRADGETAIIFKKPLNVKELVPHFDGDFLALEGFSDEKQVPKILCSKNIPDLEEKFDETVFAISGVITSEITEYKGIKAINGLTHIEELVNLIEENAIDKEILLADYH